MFERFTDRARRVIVLAQEEARLARHNHIGTEHLLLGLIHEGSGVASRVLADMGIELGEVRARVLEVTGEGADAPSGHIPFTPRAKHVLEFSLRESLQLGMNHIGTEHILLALIREGGGVAAGVLVESGADLSLVRENIVALVDTGESHRDGRRVAVLGSPGESTPVPAASRTLQAADVPFEMYVISATAQLVGDEYTAETLLSTIHASAPHLGNQPIHGLAAGLAAKIGAHPDVTSVSVTVRAPTQADGSWFSETAAWP